MMSGDDNGPGSPSSPREGDTELMPHSSQNNSATKRTGRRRKGTTTGGATDSKEGEAARRTRRKQRKQQSASEVAIKYAALFLLVAQMVGLVLLMRVSRTTGHTEGEPLYLASTAVFIMEVMKLVICCVVIAIQSVDNSDISHGLLGELKIHVIQSPLEMVKLSVPSFLYTVQNNLLYLALTNLDAATYQVCYQLKILTTAVFSMVLLQRKFTLKKWMALVLLTIGVSIVQLSGSPDANASDAEKNNRWVGLIAVLCAACTSGFSGVYFEKILKGSTTSLWLRNVQMGIPSVLIALLTTYIKDSAAITEQGFLGGYSPIVWTVVTVQAVGGLIVAVVVKYADNVLKVFATSFSIVISCVVSAIFFDFHASGAFMVGASLVVLATALYSQPERKLRRKRPPVLPK